jgi:hypothetical protein
VVNALVGEEEPENMEAWVVSINLWHRVYRAREVETIAVA